MDLITLYLSWDGMTNGAIYALVAVGLVLVFSVTRVVLVPQGDFIALGGLSLAMLEAGRTPGTVWLLAALAVGQTLIDLFVSRTMLTPRRVAGILLRSLLPGLAIVALVLALAPLKLGLPVQITLMVLMIVAMGPYIYGVVFRPLADASVLVLLITSVGVHLVLNGLGLIMFGPEGYRTTPLWEQSFMIGNLNVSGQSLLVLASTFVILALLAAFFGRTLTGKALKASSVNPRGAQLVGISTRLSGNIAFALATGIGALTAVLIGPFTTLYFDSGLVLGLKGFAGAIVGGMQIYWLSVVAALAIGLTEAFASFWASSFREIIVFASIIPVLIWRSLKDPHHDE